MSNKITYNNASDVSIRDAINFAINSTFDKYGSNWFEESEENGNIIEIVLNSNDNPITLILQNKKGSGVA